MLARVIEVGIGVAIAVALTGFAMRRSCVRFRNRHPKVGEVWRLAPRSARRRVRRAIRKGRPIERDDAVTAIDGIDTTLKFRRARRIGNSQPPLGRRLLSYGVLFIAAVVIAAVARPSLSAFAAIYVGYFGVVVLLTAAGLVQRRNWDERWLPRLAAARQSAVSVLDP
jgi:hypothetical protein